MVVLYPIASRIGGPVFTRGNLIYPPQAAELARAMWTELVRETAYAIAPDAIAQLEQATSVSQINEILALHGLPPLPEESPFVASDSPLFSWPEPPA